MGKERSACHAGERRCCRNAAWLAAAGVLALTVLLPGHAKAESPGAPLEIKPTVIRINVGDDPAWQSPALDDSTWQVVDRLAYPQEAAPASGTARPVWFRFKLESAPRRAGIPVILTAKPFQNDLRMFVDGVEVPGPQDLDPTAIRTPRSFVLPQRESTVALRWMPNGPPDAAEMPAFSLHVHDAEHVLRVLDDLRRHEFAYAAHRIVLMSVFAVFLLFHLAMYAHNRPFDRKNLFFLTTSLFCGVALGALHFSEVYHYDRAWWLAFYQYGFLALMPLSVLSGLGLFQLVAAGRLRRTLYLYAGLGVACYAASFRYGNAPVHLYPPLMIPEVAWILFARRTKGQSFLGWGAVSTVVLASVFASAAIAVAEWEPHSGFLRYAPWYFFAIFLQAVLWSFARDYARARKRMEEAAGQLRERVEAQNQELKAASDEIKALQEILPICMHCHKIRNDQQAWQQLEQYLHQRSGVLFSHGICPECLAKHYQKRDFSVDA